MGDLVPVKCDEQPGLPAKRPKNGKEVVASPVPPLESDNSQKDTIPRGLLQADLPILEQLHRARPKKIIKQTG